jgi:hypothetical protein
MLARVLLWGFLSLIGLYLAVGVWAKNDSLEKAVKCDQFKPLPNGTWVAVQNISLAYRLADDWQPRARELPVEL